MGTPVSVTEPLVGGPKTDVDGVSLSALVSSFASADYAMPESLHVQGVFSSWDGMQEGDYVWISVTHPASDGVLGAQADAGQPNVTVGAGRGPIFDPAYGAKYLEVWTAEGETKEVRRILSVVGDVVTLESNLAGTWDTSHRARARYDGFSPVRGTYGIDGGARLIGAGVMRHHNELSVTAPIPAGLLLSVRLKTSAVVGARRLALNFFFRKLFE